MSTAVFYFGGFNASKEDVERWLRSARQQKPDVAFGGYKWESGPKSWPAKTVVEGAMKSGQIQWATDDVEVCTADKIFIVGHSSGCAVANALDKTLKDTSRIALVALDGYSPDDDQLQRKTTQVWGAKCDGTTSKNFPGPSRGRRRVFETKNCYSLYALHFSVVNENAVDGKVHSIATGYLDCKANLGFLR